MLFNVKSKNILQNIFSYLDEKLKLKIVEYNKKLQNKLEIDIETYKKVYKNKIFMIKCVFINK